MKRPILFVFAAILVLLGVMVVRTVMFTSDQPDARDTDLIAVDTNAVAQRLAEAVKFETISFWAPTSEGLKAFRAFHAFLAETYPRAHEVLERETVRDFSLLYTWPGSDPSLKPLGILGHMDVVPAVDSGTQEWEYGPFEGVIADGFVWGRGTMDDKINVIGALEAIELLAAEGYAPRRTVILAFGHDEELGGPAGAQVMSALLEERGIELECVVDEGGVIVEGALPGITVPAALIGVAEKGYASFELAVQQDGGHSSMPPKNTAIGILAAGLARLEENQMPARIEGPARELFMTLGPEMGFVEKFMFANLWITEPLVQRVLSGDATSNAAIRTTTAVTMIEGGVKDNVLPTEAAAIVNFRILPGDTVDTVREHIVAVLDDERIAVRAPDGKENRDPSQVSDVNSAAYATLARTAKDVFPEVVVGPYLVLGGTDARFYENVTPNVFRFTPMIFKPGDSARLHGVNERIAVENVGQIVQFYAQLIRNFDAA
jgi:carboxypeptidase PM20D1